jgi:hypothetical protein
LFFIKIRFIVRLLQKTIHATKEAEMRKKISGLNQAFDKSYQLRIRHYHGIWLWILMMYLTGCSNKIVEIPIALHKAGSVAEADFEIAQDDGISLQLIFSTNGLPSDRDRLMDFLGRSAKFGVSVPQSVTVPLKVKIVKYTEAKELVILDKTYATTGLGSIATFELNRRVDEMNIKSGRYRIRVETIKTFHQLSDTEVQFRIYYIRETL